MATTFIRKLKTLNPDSNYERVSEVRVLWYNAVYPGSGDVSVSRAEFFWERSRHTQTFLLDP